MPFWCCAAPDERVRNVGWRTDALRARHYKHLAGTPFLAKVVSPPATRADLRKGSTMNLSADHYRMRSVPPANFARLGSGRPQAARGESAEQLTHHALWVQQQFRATANTSGASNAAGIAAEDWDHLFRAALELLTRVAVGKVLPDGTGRRVQVPGTELRECVNALDQLRRSVPIAQYRPRNGPHFRSAFL